MIVADIYGLLSESDILLIVKDAEKEADQEVIYKGYKSLLQFIAIPEGTMETAIKSFRAIPEIRHKQYKERNLTPPIAPSKTPDYLFADMQMTLYYKIII